MHVVLVTLNSFYSNSLALDYLVAYALKQNDFIDKVEFNIIVEGWDSKLDSVVKKLVDMKPDVIGFNTYIWNVEASIYTAKKVKSIIPNTVIIFGGIEATYSAEKLITRVGELDFVVLGEGELTFTKLLRNLLNGDRLNSKERGLAWRDVSGDAIIGGLGPAINKLDKIPSPFQQPDFLDRNLEKVLYETYRGCAFKCSFCLYRRDYTSRRYFSLERVRDDIKIILNSGATHIRFVDSTFNLNRKRAKDILNYLQNCRAEVSVEIIVELLDNELIRMLPTAGVHHVDIGLQSLTPSALKNINRSWFREDRFRNKLEILRSERGLALNVELIAGLPGDDFKNFCNSLNQTIMLWTDYVSIYRLLGLKGSQIQRDKENFGLIFSTIPPYELNESDTFQTSVLEQIDELIFGHMCFFNSGVGRYALRYLVEFFGLVPTAIYEDFIKIMISDKLYSIEEVRNIGRIHAFGNRGKGEMPSGLNLELVRSAIVHYINRMSLLEFKHFERELSIDLVSFGYELASLGGILRHAVLKTPERTENVGLQPWVRRRKYSCNVTMELKRQGYVLSQLPAQDVAEFIFFVHPDLGPAVLAIDDAIASQIDNLGERSNTISNVMLNKLREFAILS